MANQITPNPSVPSQVVAQLKFPRFVNNLGIIPTSYKDSMSYYECLAWLCKFLEETVIPTLNENGEAVEELQGLYVQLNSYVTNYFDNLDVQEEINNKLDDMVEQGTLQEIISAYLNSKAVFGYDTVNDMKSATNLIDGSFAKTMGYYTINDNGSAFYKIINDTNSDYNVDNSFVILLNNGLKAILIHNDNIIAESVGFKSDPSFNCGEIFNNIMTNNNTINHTVNLIFSNKTYYFSEVLIYSNLYFNLYGISNNYAPYERHTVFKPFNNNQRYILKIGGTSQFTVPEIWSTYWKTNFIIKGITFSDDNKNLKIPDSPNSKKYGLLCLEYFSGITLDVHFQNCYSQCLYIKNCWELKFDHLSFISCYYNVDESAIYIDDVLEDNYSNTSALFFEFINIEAINGSLLKTGNSCKLQNVIIDNISIENGRNFSENINGKAISIIQDETTYNSCTPIGLLEINTAVHGLQINQINLHNFGNSYYYIDNNQTKGVDTLLKLNNNFEININSINFNLCGGFQQIFGDGSIDSYIESTLLINSMNYSPRTIPQTSASQSNGDMLGYFYYNLSGGIININQTNMHYKNDSIPLLFPKLYKNLDLKNLLINKYGRLRFGKTETTEVALLKNYTSEIIAPRYRITSPCKIIISLYVTSLSESGEHGVGAYYRTEADAYGGRLFTSVSSSDVGKHVTKTITVTSEILADNPYYDLLIKGVSGYYIDYINVINT